MSHLGRGGVVPRTHRKDPAARRGACRPSNWRASRYEILQFYWARRVLAMPRNRPTARAESRNIEARLVLDEAHYREVVDLGLHGAATSIWIATANIKDAHVEAPLGSRARARGKYHSLFEWLKSKADAGIDVRILHATKPSRALGANPAWKQASHIHRCCPRVHLKMVAVDGAYLYLGSANFTGAGLGAKSEGRRNFEAGIVTDDPWMLDELQRAFDDTWSGRRCRSCRLRRQCGAPIDELVDTKLTSPRREKPKNAAREPIRLPRRVKRST